MRNAGWSPTAGSIRTLIRKTRMPSASTDLVAYNGTAPTTATGKTRDISDREAQVVAAIMREFGQYQTRRSVFAQQWEEVAELILPTSRGTFYYRDMQTPGAKKTQ